MGIDLSRLSSFTTSAKSLADLVLVTPNTSIGYQPQKQGETTPVLPNEKKFLFHYETENTVNLQSNITDHYVEDNTAVSDQISLAPEVITTQGYIGELSDIAPQSLEPIINEIKEKLTILSAYTPNLTIEALRAYNKAFAAYQTQQAVRETAVQSWSTLNENNFNLVTSDGLSPTSKPDTEKLNPQNKQQTAFQTFYGYWKNRTLFTVQTPWAVFLNMAIQNLRAIQGDTDDITSFEITFKMVRFSEAYSTDITKKAINFQGRAKQQNYSIEDFGTTIPETGKSIAEFIE